MKRTALIAASMLASSWAFAQDASLTQQAQGPASMISSTKGNVQFRHYWEDMEGKTNQQLFGQTRANLSTNFFSDQVETTLVLGFSNNDKFDKAKMNVRPPELWVEYKAFQSDYVDVNPYAYIKGLRESENTASELGIAPNFKTGTMDIGFGSLSANAKIWAGGVFTSNKEKQPVRAGNDYGTLSLTGDSKKDVKKGERGVEYRVWYNPNVTWATPAEGLSLSLTADWMHSYEPVREIYSNETGAIVDEKVVYDETMYYDTYLSVVYKATDKVSLTNRVYHNTAGFESSKTKWTNMAMVTYSIY